jgi:DNA mismatch repair protein MutS
VLETARAVAEIDVLVGLAQTAAENKYVAPSIDEGSQIHFVEGRHPVIEKSPSCETFVPNDCTLDHDGERITILTGPNMAGKSTYIRQTALIVLLAQIGSFVPAEKAHIGVVDRIFTRVGAGDDISRGESTFMVEMVEIANILNNASKRSLVVLDEVGRGTSTFDGLSLAWSIAEHLHENIGCRTLFATHYHQLTDLCQTFPGVVNRNVAVRESGDEIVFLHKIIAGGTDRSYGIHVARLAGVPHPVLERARAILADIEADEVDLTARILSQSEASSDQPIPKLRAKSPKSPTQLGLFVAPPSEVEEALKDLDLDCLTPIDALLQLRELKSKLSKG